MTDVAAPGHGYGSLAVSLRFASGAVGSLVGTYDSSYAYRGTQTLEVNGTSGRLTVEDSVRRYTFQAAGQETAEVWEAGYFNDRDRRFTATFDRLVHATLKALRAGDPPPVPAAAGRRALEVAVAAIRSFERGERVAVPVPPES